MEMEIYLTCWGKKQNVSESDTSESLRLLLQPSREVKITAFKRHMRTTAVASAFSSTRKDVPRSKSLIFEAKPSSINMLQRETGETGEETEITVHV